MSLLAISEILAFFVNTLATDDKYSLWYSKNLPQPIQMKLSKEQKTFSQVFAKFRQSTSNLKHLQQKYGPHGFFISKIRNRERRGLLNVWKAQFQNTFW